MYKKKNKKKKMKVKKSIIAHIASCLIGRLYSAIFTQKVSGIITAVAVGEICQQEMGDNNDCRELEVFSMAEVVPR